ncbi:AbiV family abortive infection protein [Methylotenera sp.]|uniref:AbiV family abortive infection protein n=1 Tax=Methylotenera sp. TaxID=2051956 RepID=UPI0024880C87|nr:AbiV family abortive infection protein [Methylotenera sp.]MDI1361914.1 AbiV family abortive infection protein [Methylotenera sp.]
MRTTLSRYKFQRLARESLRNSLRLHSDAILLYENSSYPSAFQLAVLALEELAKAKWVSHYYYSSITNEGFPEADFEQHWLMLLYSHTEKQYAFIARDVFDYSPKLVKFIKAKKLELKKQQSTYVSLERANRNVDVSGRISTPERLKQKDAKQLISLVNNEFIEIYECVLLNGECFGINEVDNVISSEEHQFLFVWPHKPGLKSRHFLKQHIVLSE